MPMPIKIAIPINVHVVPTLCRTPSFQSAARRPPTRTMKTNKVHSCPFHDYLRDTAVHRRRRCRRCQRTKELRPDRNRQRQAIIPVLMAPLISLKVLQVGFPGIELSDGASQCRSTAALQNMPAQGNAGSLTAAWCSRTAAPRSTSRKPDSARPTLNFGCNNVPCTNNGALTRRIRRCLGSLCAYDPPSGVESTRPSR